MHPQISQYTLSLIIILISFSLPTTYSQFQQYTNCSSLYNCGESIRGVGYPFWGQRRAPECGFQGLELKCQDNHTSTIEINNQTFRVLEIVPNAHTITVARNDLWENVCPRVFFNTTLNDTLYKYDRNTDQFLDLYYSCSSNVSVSARTTFTCNTDGRDRVGFYDDRSDGSVSLINPQSCEANITVPVLRIAMDEFRVNEAMPLVELINQGFRLEYKVNHSACSACQSSRGVCWSGTNTSTPTCLCREGVSTSVCHDNGSRTLSVKIIIGIVCGGVAMVCLAIGIIIYFNCQKSAFIELLTFWKSKTQNDKNIEAFITQYGFSAPKRYKFFEIKKMTNSFKDELGQGGFGSVFKGRLIDGTLVAVKVLKESKGSGEDFINEVASIGKTSHINIVALLGFCYEGQKRALIYEFMPNGSLEKFIYHSNNLTESAKHLGVEKLFEIAVGIARGLEYLHRGCSTHILHFDIKPHNILLDEDFCPKISDFGLAKLYSRKESVISSVEARGTIGYTAPEVFNRSFGGVSHKSDVYSYGMMVLEMVGGRKNLDIRANSSEIYFPQWIYKKIELDEHVRIPIVENEIARKMIIVGLWCIQTNPSERPSMNKVIEMLEGSMEGLRIPPDPFFPSPESSPLSSFTTLESISLVS